MIEGKIFSELKERIKADVHYFKDKLPRENAIAWHGYIMALLEWGLLTINEHSQLCDLLPKLANNPVAAIAIGRGGG